MLESWHDDWKRNESEWAKAEAERERERRWLWPFGLFGRLATYAVLFIAWWAYFPSHVFGQPLATLTLADIGAALFMAALGIGLVRCLFEPSQEVSAKDGWNVIGVMYACGIPAAYMYLSGWFTR